MSNDNDDHEGCLDKAKWQFFGVCIILAVAVLGIATALADAPPRSTPVPTVEATLLQSPVAKTFLPLVTAEVAPCLMPGNLAANPSAECGEAGWAFTFPNTENILCDCDGWNCPTPFGGRCIFRYGDWHDDWETGKSSGFYLVPGPTYELSFRYLVWTEELPLTGDFDFLDAYLIDHNGYHHHILTLTNRSETLDWRLSTFTITVGEAGVRRLLFVCITDSEKPLYGGKTNFYLDDIRLHEIGDCEECVQCQLGTQAPETFCVDGNGDDCTGCCPNGDDCAGLDAKCPVLPPPHFYRELDRWAVCH